jgi:thiosulfate/3-mercaptopyruvate sulfurtransferase
MAETESTANYLIDARFLSDRRDDPNLILIDTRPAKDYWAGHLAGARHFNPLPFNHNDTSERGVSEFGAQLEWIFSALGISGKETAVFYENDSGMRAARGLWLLEYAGHPKVRMLDGGLKSASSEKLVTTVEKFAPTRFVLQPRAEVLATFTHLRERIGHLDVQVFDVRSDAEYYSERLRARYGGAIPCAWHQDWTSAMGSDGKLKSPDELRANFQKIGLDPEAEVIAYCQSGYSSAHAYLALKVAGYRKVSNYYGSWAEWGNRDDLPREHPRRKS